MAPLWWTSLLLTSAAHRLLCCCGCCSSLPAANNLVAVLDGYFIKGGHHINVNVLNRCGWLPLCYLFSVLANQGAQQEAKRARVLDVFHNSFSVSCLVAGGWHLLC